MIHFSYLISHFSFQLPLINMSAFNLPKLSITSFVVLVKGDSYSMANIVNVCNKGVTCDCKPFLYRKKHFVCDHIRFVEKQIGGVAIDGCVTVSDLLSAEHIENIV
jgi:hypothetical protein